jgi:hypothetical protein
MCLNSPTSKQSLFHQTSHRTEHSYLCSARLRPRAAEVLCGKNQFGIRVSGLSALEANRIRKSSRSPEPTALENRYKVPLMEVTVENKDTIELPDFIVLEKDKIMKLRLFDAQVQSRKG